MGSLVLVILGLTVQVGLRYKRSVLSLARARATIEISLFV